MTEEDLARWQRENHQDILNVIEHGHVMWAGDRMISTATGHYADGCPFLIAKEGKWLCSIYDTRPRVCRNYEPGSSEICPQWHSGIKDGKR